MDVKTKCDYAMLKEIRANKVKCISEAKVKKIEQILIASLKEKGIELKENV